MRIILFLSLLMVPYYPAFGQVNDNPLNAQNQNNTPTRVQSFSDRINKLQQQGKISKEQAQNLIEQEKTYGGGVPQSEVEYYEETAPQPSDDDPDFLMRSHPLQEGRIPSNPIK